VWTDFDSWRVTVPVSLGANVLQFQALNFQGTQVATDTITVTSTVASPIVDFLRISELMYHPADPSPSELAAGFVDADEFEFIELVNVSPTQTLNLAGVTLSDAVSFTFGNVTLLPGARMVLAVDPAAFAQRYGASIPVAGQFTGQLNNSGEHLVLADSRGATILDFTYDDTGAGWHPTTDGDGYSLVILDELGPTANWNNGPSWRPSSSIGGSPGTADSLAGDFNGDGRVDLADLAILQIHLGAASGATPLTGDLTGDGAVTRADAAEFARLFGKSTPAPSPPAPLAVVRRAASVAEPTARPRRPLAAAADRALAEISSAGLEPRTLLSAKSTLRRTIHRT
jgi:hypothetical protein